MNTVIDKSEISSSEMKNARLMSNPPKSSPSSFILSEEESAALNSTLSRYPNHFDITLTCWVGKHPKAKSGIDRCGRLRSILDKIHGLGIGSETLKGRFFEDLPAGITNGSISLLNDRSGLAGRVCVRAKSIGFERFHDL